MMSGVQRLQSIFSLEQIVLHKLAKFCWGKFILKENIDDERICSCHRDTFCFQTRNLVLYRDEVIKKVPEMLNRLPRASYWNMPQKTIDKVINAVFIFFQGYYEALEWEEHLNWFLSVSIVDPFASGKYQAENYIDADGNFNDYEWAKKIVADEDEYIHSRFEFACLYCFEEYIIKFWNIMKRKKELPCEGDLNCIRRHYDPLIAIWAVHVEGKYEEIPDFSNKSFFYAGLLAAFESDFKYAVQYFWKLCSVMEKAKFYQDVHILVDWWINKYISARTNNFIYCLLSQDQKQKYICQSVEMHKMPFMIWSLLLHSRFYESVLKDILSFTISVPLEAYARLLDSLAEEIMDKQIPRHKKIFKEIWNHLSIKQQKGILEMENETISNLAIIKFIDLY